VAEFHQEDKRERHDQNADGLKQTGVAEGDGDQVQPFADAVDETEDPEEMPGEFLALRLPQGDADGRQDDEGESVL
jgi:hypothetical protein